MKKQSSWFSHDSNASLDPKIIALTATHGIAGYGRWWRLVEILRAEERYRYNITTPFAYSVLAKELVCTTEEAKQFIHDCIHSYQLLHTDEECIWSASLCGRMKFMDDKAEELRKRASNGGKASQAKARANAQAQLEAMSSTSEAKEIKENETKQNETTTTSDGEGGEVETVKEEKKIAPDWNTHKQQALQDTGFTYAIISTGKLNEKQLDQ